jgi:hydrogenase expression/formation protein HypC
MCLAIPGLLEERTGDDPLMAVGRVRFGGIVKEVSLACLPEARVGDYILVHAGVGIAVVDEDEAREVFAYLEELGELAELDPQAGGGKEQAP